VYEKAQGVQDAYYDAEGKNLVAIVIVGSGIATRSSNGSSWVQQDKNLTISDVIKSFDDDERYGLDTPIFLFGFSQMTRGISFRSDRRVPTHIIVSRGGGYSVEDMVQTMGRATFCGKVVLEKNGFEGVTVLATYQDLTCAKNTRSCPILSRCAYGKEIRCWKRFPGHCTRFRTMLTLAGTRTGRLGLVESTTE
jgi:hypothetical protein